MPSRDSHARMRARVREVANSPRPACWSWEVTQHALDEAYRARTQEDAFYVLMQWQLGRCAICSAGDRELVFDHDHDTGLIRGLLCTSCNQIEARQDPPAIALYRHINPAFMLDMHIRKRPGLTGRRR